MSNTPTTWISAAHPASYEKPAATKTSFLGRLRVLPPPRPGSAQLIQPATRDRPLQRPRFSDACGSFHPHDLDQRSSSSQLRETVRYKDLVLQTLAGPAAPTTWISMSSSN
ncbi:MAG: hypothetical protein AAF741_07935 [Bacteroidota bacterium]